MKKGYKSIITFSSLLLASITVDAIPFVNNKSLFINAKATSNYSFVLGASNITSTSYDGDSFCYVHEIKLEAKTPLNYDYSALLFVYAYNDGIVDFVDSNIFECTSYGSFDMILEYNLDVVSSYSITVFGSHNGENFSEVYNSIIEDGQEKIKINISYQDIDYDYEAEEDINNTISFSLNRLVISYSC